MRALVWSFALAGFPAGAADLHDYAWTFTIETPAGVESSAWRVDLDPAVYAWVRDPALRDVAVFNAEGEPVPVARVAAETMAQAHEHTEALPLLALPADGAVAGGGDLRLLIERDAQGRLRRLDAGDDAATKAGERAWLVDASGLDGAIERIILAWESPASGVVARFEISAGDDLEHWRRVGEGSVLSLREGDARLDRNDIALPDVRAKYLRLRRVDDGAALAGLNASVRVVERAAAVPLRRWIDARAVELPADERGATARYAYALPAALPVEQARVELASDNALAALTLSARDGAAWSELARFTAFRLRSGEETLRNGDIDLVAPRRLDTFRLDARTPLATAPRLAFAFRPDRFVFLAEGAAPYRLAVGSAIARRPDYPLDAALASLRASRGRDWQPPQATLGAGRASGGDAALLPPPTPTPWRQWLLWGVLALGAALVGAFALNLLRERR
ncbi:DUF3999 domain-containing protein [Dokdonella fugitiva]|jgi:hypothetical protein|uniref:Uncharacterized protein DUF3999 n=1 Tax=Dokdonella fugitiva TaxID=328517 RepID=A0A4R2I274_9GAMM|nr:DUF3999 domain-containing protein [Dokdonella fugitiva]TCO37746.1 uncharacterized protein DUF3999 [Dokdonella fugitiva]